MNEATKKLKWLIWSLEHDSWWKPNHQGYTLKKEEAGRYSFEEALKIAISANHYRGNNPPLEAMLPDSNDQ